MIRLNGMDAILLYGPRERGEVGGLQVTQFYSTGVLSAGVAVNITMWSYVDQLNISVLADDETFHDIHEATDAIVHAFTEIRCAAGLFAGLSPLASAMAAVSAHDRTKEAPGDIGS